MRALHSQLKGKSKEEPEGRGEKEEDEEKVKEKEIKEQTIKSSDKLTGRMSSGLNDNGRAISTKRRRLLVVQIRHRLDRDSLLRRNVKKNDGRVAGGIFQDDAERGGGGVIERPVKLKALAEPEDQQEECGKRLRERETEIRESERERRVRKRKKEGMRKGGEREKRREERRERGREERRERTWNREKERGREK